jgi:hypothetical protein
MGRARFPGNGSAVSRPVPGEQIHHHGAIAMARDEQSDGRGPDAKRPAGRIVRSRTDKAAALHGIAGGR